MVKKIVLFLILVAIVLAPGCTAKQAENIILKVGSLPRVFDIIAYAAQQEGLYAKKNINVEIVPFKSTTEMNTALVSGAIDGIIQGTFEAVNLNKDQGVGKLVGSASMPHMFEVIVNGSSGINSTTQLKGQEIATGASTIMDYALDRLLIAQGVSPKDITKVNIPAMPLRLETLVLGKVPAAILTSPLSDLAVFKGCKIIISDTAQPFGGPGLIFSIKALEGKPNTVGKFVQVWQESVQMINANPEKYQDLLATVANVSKEIANSLQVPALPKLGLPSESEMKSIMDWMEANKILTSRPAYSDMVDTKYIK